MHNNSTGLLRHIKALNHWNKAHFRPLTISGQAVGFVKDFMCEALSQWPQYFSITRDKVDLVVGENHFDELSLVLEEVVHRLVEQQVIPGYLGESYPVTGKNREQQFALLDRGAAGYFGIRTYGQHLNGYVKTEAGLKLWIARRSADRIQFPNRLDNLVAGGLPQNLSLQENLLKECQEEADIPEYLVNNARASGALSYCCEVEIGLKPDTLYCYDLELPESFIPCNTDGEVAEFKLMDLPTVFNLVLETDEFKPNCNLVILDFFIRHGFIGPEYVDYQELVNDLQESYGQ